MPMKKWFLLLSIFYCLHYNGISQNIILEKDVISSGATNSKNDNIILNATIGQPVIGLTQGTIMKANQGFWYVVSDFDAGSSTTEDLLIGILDLTIVPNPASYQGTLTFNANERMAVKVDIINSLGQKTAFNYSGDVIEGKNIIPIDLSNLLSGQYFLSLTAKEKIFTKKIVIIK